MHRRLLCELATPDTHKNEANNYTHKLRRRVLCKRCWLGYSDGGWAELNLPFATWAAKCNSDKAFNKKVEDAIALSSGEYPKDWDLEDIRFVSGYPTKPSQGSLL